MEITGRSRGLRSPRGSSWPLIISAIAHRYAPLFEVGDLSTEKGNTDIGGLNFRGQPASHLFAGLRFWANYRCGAFLHDFRDAHSQERSQQWDHSPTYQGATPPAWYSGVAWTGGSYRDCGGRDTICQGEGPDCGVNCAISVVATTTQTQPIIAASPI